MRQNSTEWIKYFLQYLEKTEPSLKTFLLLPLSDAGISLNHFQVLAKKDGRYEVSQMGLTWEHRTTTSCRL